MPRFMPCIPLNTLDHIFLCCFLALRLVIIQHFSCRAKLIAILSPPQPLQDFGISSLVLVSADMCHQLIKQQCSEPSRANIVSSSCLNDCKRPLSDCPVGLHQQLPHTLCRARSRSGGTPESSQGLQMGPASSHRGSGRLAHAQVQGAHCRREHAQLQCLQQEQSAEKVGEGMEGGHTPPGRSRFRAK